MKSTLITLIVATLIVGILNLCASFGLFGGGNNGSGGGEYLVLSPAKMDQIGFASIAKEDGLEANEKGEVTLKAQDLAKDPRAFRPNMMARSIKEVEKDGYTFISVTSDNLYIFKK